jgi:hypothetical protein
MGMATAVSQPASLQDTGLSIVGPGRASEHLRLNRGLLRQTNHFPRVPISFALLSGWHCPWAYPGSAPDSSSRLAIARRLMCANMALKPRMRWRERARSKPVHR